MVGNKGNTPLRRAYQNPWSPRSCAGTAASDVPASVLQHGPFAFAFPRRTLGTRIIANENRQAHGSQPMGLVEFIPLATASHARKAHKSQQGRDEEYQRCRFWNDRGDHPGIVRGNMTCSSRQACGLPNATRSLVAPVIMRIVIPFNTPDPDRRHVID
jgi:hypothetical protein